jgi:hypothetical protein
MPHSKESGKQTFADLSSALSLNDRSVSARPLWKLTDIMNKPLQDLICFVLEKHSLI